MDVCCNPMTKKFFSPLQNWKKEKLCFLWTKSNHRWSCVLSSARHIWNNDIPSKLQLVVGKFHSLKYFERLSWKKGVKNHMELKCSFGMETWGSNYVLRKSLYEEPDKDKGICLYIYCKGRGNNIVTRISD